MLYDINRPRAGTEEMAPEVGAGGGKSHGRDGKGAGFGAHSLSGPAVTLTIVIVGKRDQAEPRSSLVWGPGLPFWAGPF